MYAIDTSNHTVNDKKVDTFLRTVLDGDTRLEVEAGTTGFSGACCRDAGSRTYLALLCRKGDFFFGPIKDDEGRTVGIRIACCGDEGLNAIMKSLAFAYHAIEVARVCLSCDRRSVLRCGRLKKKKGRPVRFRSARIWRISDVQYLLR